VKPKVETKEDVVDEEEDDTDIQVIS